MNKLKIGDIFQTHLGKQSFLKVLDILEFGYKVQYIKSRHGVQIRKGRIFIIHNDWLKNRGI